MPPSKMHPRLRSYEETCLQFRKLSEETPTLRSSLKHTYQEVVKGSVHTPPSTYTLSSSHEQFFLISRATCNPLVEFYLVNKNFLILVPPRLKSETSVHLNCHVY